MYRRICTKSGNISLWKLHKYIYQRKNKQKKNKKEENNFSQIAYERIVVILSPKKKKILNNFIDIIVNRMEKEFSKTILSKKTNNSYSLIECRSKTKIRERCQNITFDVVKFEKKKNALKI